LQADSHTPQSKNCSVEYKAGESSLSGGDANQHHHRFILRFKFFGKSLLSDVVAAGKFYRPALRLISA